MLATVANKRKIEVATSPKDDVAPVYLLEDIWQIINTSGQDTALGLVDFINKRLSNKSPVVKQKTLRLIKFLCAKGASDFKRGISKHAAVVRDLTHYRGDPDPFKGDTINQKVRDTAKEAVDAMFAPVDTPSYSTPASSSLQSRIQGFGSSQGPESSSVGPNSSNKGFSGLLGFGNPRGNGDTSNVNRSSSSKGFGKRGDLRSSTNGYASTSGNQRSGALSPKGIMESISAKGSELMQRGKGASFLSNDDHTGYSSDDTERGYDQPGAIAPTNRVSLKTQNGGASTGTGGDAARLVNQICTPGGLRAQPSREDLRIFVESVGSQNGARIAELLEDKMSDSSWQAVLRALTSLEAIIQQGSTASCGEVAVYFQSNPAALEGALDFPQASVRGRASRVLQLLGISESVPESRAAAGGKVATAAAPDLLGGLLDEPEPAEQAVIPSSDGDMLGGLLSDDTASALPPSNGIFNGLDFGTSASTVSAAQSSPELDLLGVSPTAIPQQRTSQAQQSSDPFGGLGNFGSQQIAEPKSNDLFGGLAIGQQGASVNQASDLLGNGTSSSSAAGMRASSISAANGELVDIFSNLSTSKSSRPGLGSASQLMPQEIAAQRAASLDKHADPLASIGLPQAHKAPMGQGFSAQRGSSPIASMPGPAAQQSGGGMAAMSMGFPGVQMPGPQSLTPQQIHYVRQMQYMQYMQQMQAMQARGMMPPNQLPFPQQQPIASGFGGSLQNPTFQQSTGYQSSNLGGPISLEALAGPSIGNPSSSSTLGITQQSDFDFVSVSQIQQSRDVAIQARHHLTEQEHST